MSLSVLFINLAGTVALLLWGVRMVQTGIQRAFGARLRVILGGALQNRLSAFLAGVGVTAVLQSSTATGLMMTGFAATGLVALMPALAVMLGANVGTTLIVQLLSFDIAQAAPAFILGGFLLFRRASAGRHHFGRVLIGLGLVLMSLHHFMDLLAPYEEVATLGPVLDAIASQAMLVMLVAAALAWAVHSSVVVVLLAMSLVTQGVIPVETAFALVLGANLGTAVNPVLEGPGGSNPAGKRLPVGNLITRAVGVALGLILLPHVSPLLIHLEGDQGRLVADFHTGFNLVLALLFMPWLGQYARLLTRWLPDRSDAMDAGRPLYLDASASRNPEVALGAAGREVLRMVDVLDDMLNGFRGLLQRPDRRALVRIRRADDVLDKLNAAVKAYVLSLEPASLTEDDEERINDILIFATHIEQAGDIVDRNLLSLAAKKMKRGLAFSPEGSAELLHLTDRLIANAQQTATLFITRDIRAARRLADEKRIFREYEAAATTAHFERLRAGRVDTQETSSLHLDVLRDLKHVNAHLVSAAAYPVLERHHELLPTRVLVEG